MTFMGKKYMTFMGKKVIHMLILVSFISQAQNNEMLNSPKSFVNKERNSLFSTSSFTN